MHSTLVAGHLIEQIYLYGKQELRKGLAQPGVRRPGSKGCGDGTRAVGGRHVWLISVATISWDTGMQGDGPQEQAQYNHYRL